MNELISIARKVNTTLFRLLFSRRFRNLKGLLNETRRYNPPTGDSFFDSLMFFSYLFYLRGFLFPGPVNQVPAFPNAYKNISTDVFKKTYVALPVYFALRYDSQASPFAPSDKLLNMLLKTYTTLDLTTLKRLYSDWKGLTKDELARQLYQHFRDYGVFRKVFAGDDAEVEKWFTNFLNQTYDYVVRQAKHMTKF